MVVVPCSGLPKMIFLAVAEAKGKGKGGKTSALKGEAES